VYALFVVEGVVEAERRGLVFEMELDRICSFPDASAAVTGGTTLPCMLDDRALFFLFEVPNPI
jgi:hypothetical protein